MKSQNVFTDKIISDIDYSLLKNNQWVFPTQNIRVFNKKGNGFIATVVDGNELLFEVSSGFTIIGACEYNGFVFLACHNDTTGEGEVGSYPSYELTREYKPLNNYTAGKFRTDRFEFSLSNPVDMIAKTSYDESLDLYLCDYLNVNKVINTGFILSSGESNGVVYDDDSFDGMINHMPISTKEIVLGNGDNVISSGGYLLPGNYYVYFRYSTSSYASTAFVKELGPFSIGDNNTAISYKGEQEKDWIRDNDNVTDKKMTFNLSGLDTNYKYLEIGIIRYSALQENAKAQQNTYRIDKYYEITGSNMSVTVYGNESQTILLYEEVLNPVLEYSICKAHTQVLDRYMGVSWKKESLSYDRDALIEFASLIEIGEAHDDVLTTDSSKPYPTITEYENGSVVDLQHYQDGNNVHMYTGYFKGQIYPFAIKFKFSNGSESEAFPCKGTDDNTKGLFKFSEWRDIASPEKQDLITNVTFSPTNAIAYYTNLSPEEKESKFGSVIGYYYVRGERIDNFIGQGVLIRGFYGVSLVVANECETGFRTFGAPLLDCSSGGYSTSYDPNSSHIMPLLQGNYPMIREESGPAYWYGWCNEYQTGYFPGIESTPTAPNGHSSLPIAYTYWTTAVSDYEHSHGLFIPDMLFTQDTNIPDDAYIDPIFRFGTTNIDDFLLKKVRLLPQVYALDLNSRLGDVNISEYESWKNMSVSASFVEKGQYRSKYGFSSYHPMVGDNAGIYLNDGSVQNRNIGTCRYIGIVDRTTGRLLKNLHFNYQYDYNVITICNLYKYANDDAFFTATLNSFNVATTVYSAISNLIKINTYGTQNIYKGDCFLQKTFFRSHRWYAMEKAGNTQVDTSTGITGFGGMYGDDAGNWWQHGLMIGIVTENKYNTEARNEVTGRDDDLNYIRYTYYPKVRSYLGTLNWAVIEAGDYLQEATQINDGYNKVLSDKVVVGYEETEPDREESRPNRVYVSDPHITGSFVDGYRIIKLGSYRDYGLEYGYIIDIEKIRDYPLIVHERGISQIYINDRAIQSTDVGDNILGASVMFLSDRYRNLSDYGSQHKLSIISGKRGVYGIDAIKRIIWRVGVTQSQGGGFFLNAEDISTQKFIQSHLKELFDLYTTYTDSIAMMPDTPLLGTGINSGVDPDFNEVLFSFHFPISPDADEGSMLYPDNGARVDYTLVFDELIDGFKGSYSHAEPYYFNLGNALLSDRHILDDAMQWTLDNKVYKYNTGNPNTFFGNISTVKLSFVVNGIGEDKNDFSKMVKIFRALEVECKRYAFSIIRYETLYQGGVYTFDEDTKDFWCIPEYKEHRWYVPITIQTTGEEDDFEEDSEMRGLWMKVTLEYQGNDELDIRSILTEFDISFV